MKPVVVFIFFFCIFLNSSQAQLPDGFIRERIATGLNPTSMAYTPDGRIFITQKDGDIIVIRDQVILDEPLLSIEVDDSNERGLGHLVFHPDFESNGFFYVHYTVPGRKFNRVSRFTANGDKAIPGSEQIIIDLDECQSDVHNGGAMVFGIDGYLYIATGDGGESWRGNDLGSTNGKILRLDEDGQSVPDNPWYDLNDRRANTVYAYGLRNPFTMAIHPQTGEIYANDVGGSSYEEVNHIAKGGFYGWPVVEGKESGQELPAEYVDPLFQYSHNNNYCSIVGGAFYSPSESKFPPSYSGLYFYSDYCTGDIRMLDVGTGMDKGIFISDGDRVVDLMVTPSGDFYYLERKGMGDGSIEDNTGTNEGALWKVSYSGAGTPFISLQPESILVSEGEDANFDIKASGALPLTYTWFVNGQEVNSNNQPFLFIGNVSTSLDSSTISVTIMNGHGVALSDTVLLSVTSNHRPGATILFPSADTRYQGGDIIQFSGLATDDEDGTIPPSSFYWKIDFHHGTHSHPAMSWISGTMQGEWTIPSIGETSSDVWYRIYLKVIDSEGLTKVVYRDIHPKVGSIYITSKPAGLKINLDGAPNATPFQIEGVAGISRYITAPVKQVMGDSVYFFEKWNNGSAQHNREIFTSLENQSFLGTFNGYPIGHGEGLTGRYYANTTLSGDPVFIRVDPTIDYQFHFKSPDPLLPEDYFSIQWDGYIQTYKSGDVKFTVFADDGVIVEIDGIPVINEFNPGFHYVTGNRFLEQGRLYPMRIKMFDDQYNSNIRLRWSSTDFNEEIIPSSQLYPEDYLTGKIASGFLSIGTITSQGLELFTETYKELHLDLSIFSLTGVELLFPDQIIPAGKALVTLKVQQLPPGVYFLTGIDRSNGEKVVTKFVKVH